MEIFFMILFISCVCSVHVWINYAWHLKPSVRWMRLLLKTNARSKLKIAFQEILAFVIFPIIGYGTCFYFSVDGYWDDVFGPRYFPIFLVAQIFCFIMYFISRKYKYKLGPLFLYLAPAFLFLGIISCLLLAIHLSFVFLMSITFGWITIILPFLASAYYALFTSAAFMAIEIYNLLKIAEEKNILVNSYPPLAEKLIYWYYGKHSPWIQILLAPIIIFYLNFLLQFIYPEVPSVFFAALSECSTGFITEGERPSSSDYLVTIASFGNEKLVKPKFIGYRNGHRIKVNRQLQVCNAFEEQMQMHFPKLHKPLRQFYDSLQIPIAKWKHKKLLANILFIFFIPLEKIFLLYLYLFVPNPEKEIYRQYRKV